MNGAPQRQRIGLAAAAGEDDILGPRARQRRNLRSRPFDHGARGASARHAPTRHCRRCQARDSIASLASARKGDVAL